MAVHDALCPEAQDGYHFPHFAERSFFHYCYRAVTLATDPRSLGINPLYVGVAIVAVASHDFVLHQPICKATDQLLDLTSVSTLRVGVLPDCLRRIPNVALNQFWVGITGASTLRSAAGHISESALRMTTRTSLRRLLRLEDVITPLHIQKLIFPSNRCLWHPYGQRDSLARLLQLSMIVGLACISHNKRDETVTKS